MTALYELSEVCRTLFSLWALLLCCAGIAGTVLSFAVKRAGYALASLAVFLPPYFLWQAVYSQQRFGRANHIVKISIRSGALPWLIWFAALALLTALTVSVITRSIRYIRDEITPVSIKLCADRMPCGICYWRDNGRVILSNSCMDTICIALSGRPLMNGNSFHDAVTDGIHAGLQKKWSFAYRTLMFDGEPLHEMIAWDVTENYEKIETLRHDNEALERVNKELKAYSLKIDETVRRQEILQARANIHDEMNRLMLSTVAADPENGQEMERILELWRQDTLLLCMEADEKKNQNTAQELKGLARQLELELAGTEFIPDALAGKQRELFFAAAKEAIVNAVKHAQAKHMKLTFEETESRILCRFENDGKMPESEIRFTGGLATLSLLAQEQNADVSAENGETFRLTLGFQKEC